MKKYPVARPYVDAEDKKSILQVLNSGYLSLGKKYLEFEKNIAKFVGTKYGCAISSGTAGLHLAVKALDLKEGDEVITTPFSFISSTNCLLFERIKPVFVDIEEETANMNPAKIEAVISKKTKAILVVDIFGQTPDMDPIIKIAKKYRLKIIEDACESLGATYKGKMAGTFGDIAVFAFYPNKQMTTGEGGMIVTDNEKYYRLCDSLRNQGRNDKGDWLIHVRLGYNYRMDELSASLGVTQLKKLVWMIEKKRKVAEMYNRYLSKTEGISIPKLSSDRTNSWYVYTIRVKNGKRNELMKRLAEIGIQTKPYMPAIHLQPYIKKMFGFKKGDFPLAEKVADESLALPFFIGLNSEDIKYISAQIAKLLT